MRYISAQIIPAFTTQTIPAFTTQKIVAAELQIDLLFSKRFFFTFFM